MEKTYKAKLSYTIKATHPDFACLADKDKWTPHRVYVDKDEYRINTDCFTGEDAIREYIKEDMMTVAAGGYNWNGIGDVEFSLVGIAS